MRGGRKAAGVGRGLRYSLLESKARKLPSDLANDDEHDAPDRLGDESHRGNPGDAQSSDAHQLPSLYVIGERLHFRHVSDNCGRRRLKVPDATDKFIHAAVNGGTAFRCLVFSAVRALFYSTAGTCRARIPAASSPSWRRTAAPVSVAAISALPRVSRIPPSSRRRRRGGRRPCDQSASHLPASPLARRPDPCRRPAAGPRHLPAPKSHSPSGQLS